MAERDARRWLGEDQELTRLWISLLCGPVAWALNETVGYALVKPVCAGWQVSVLTAIAAGALTVVILGVWIASTSLQRLGPQDSSSAHPGGRSFAMAQISIGLNGLFVLLIVVSAMPHFFLDPCE